MDTVELSYRYSSAVQTSTVPQPDHIIANRHDLYQVQSRPTVKRTGQNGFNELRAGAEPGHALANTSKWSFEHRTSGFEGETLNASKRPERRNAFQNHIGPHSFRSRSPIPAGLPAHASLARAHSDQGYWTWVRPHDFEQYWCSSCWALLPQVSVPQTDSPLLLLRVGDVSPRAQHDP